MPDIIAGVEDTSAPTSDIYLRGDINGWGTSYKFEKNSDGIYELNLERLEGAFKIAGPEWNVGNVDFGGATDIELNKAVKLTTKGGNCTLANGTANDVTLLFDWSTKTLTIKGASGGNNEGDEMGLTRRVFFKNDNVTRAATWTTPHVYTWSPEKHGEWPGTAMTETSINGQQYWVSEWTVDSPDQHTPGTSFLKFNNGKDGDQQPNDQTYYHNQVYTSVGAADEQLSGIASVETEQAAAEYFTLQGTRVAADSLTPGLYIVRRGNKVSKILVK